MAWTISTENNLIALGGALLDVHQVTILLWQSNNTQDALSNLSITRFSDCIT